MKILILSLYSRLGASSRLRMIQYQASMTESGLQVEVVPFFDDTYLKRLYAGGKPSFATLGFFVTRLRCLLSHRRVDLVWVEKELFPWLPWFLERTLIPRNIPLVSDYDDAIFHRYDKHKNVLVRSLLGSKIDRIMAASALVIAGNQYLADRAEAAGAKHVEIVPTVLNANAYSTERPKAKDGRQRIGWIGSPSTWAAYGAPIMPLLTSIANRHGAMIRLVGAGQSAMPGYILETLPWSEESEVPLIQGMDVGIMPLDDSPWARGKCGYKLIQYMACGLPVVASPVGVNKEIVEHGVNGFLAETESEWASALDALLGDAELRRRMGMAGRKKVERDYSLQAYGPRVAAMLLDVAHSGKSQAR